MWQANCYVLGDHARGTAVVVDPGQDAGPTVQACLERHNVRAESILLTHGHLDHVWSAPELAAQLDVQVFLHGDDRWLWDNPVAAFGNLPPGVLADQFGLDWRPDAERLEWLADGMKLTCAGLQVEVHHTPGHTPGSSVFLLRETGTDDPVLLSGDLIFAGSVGRTDFPRGSFEDQNESIKRVVLPLDDATRIFSGHGPETTVGVERGTNPFVVPLG
jgi:glyoxylase-like metal-dependent hydrolase (beta-lactamase superfamily II)